MATHSLSKLTQWVQTQIEQVQNIVKKPVNGIESCRLATGILPDLFIESESESGVMKK